MTKPMVSRGCFALTVLLACGGAHAEQSKATIFTATCGRNAYTFQIGDDAPRVERGLSWGQSLTGFSAVGAETINNIAVFGCYDDGTGELFALRGEPGEYWLDPIAKTPFVYHTFTLVGERLFAARDAGGDEDVIVELEPGTLRETHAFGRFELAIEGMVYVPETDELVISDRLTSAFYAVEFGRGDKAGAVRTIGQAGFALGSNGLDYRDGEVYAAAVRQDDGALVFGRVSLANGSIDVILTLDEQAEGEVGLGSTVDTNTSEMEKPKHFMEFGSPLERAWHAAGLGIPDTFGGHAAFAGSGGGGSSGSPIDDGVIDLPDDGTTPPDEGPTDTSTTPDDGGSGEGGGGTPEVPSPGTLSVLGISGFFLRRRR
ncbi:MAG: hypothetical protein Kow0022_01800 [Phycisphaerales bacterium]